MKKVITLLLLIFLFLVANTYNPTSVFADEIEDLQKQINELNKARELSVVATKPLEGQLNSLKIQYSLYNNNLCETEVSICLIK